jgi:hypothetical protein
MFEHFVYLAGPDVYKRYRFRLRLGYQWNCSDYGAFLLYILLTGSFFFAKLTDSISMFRSVLVHMGSYIDGEYA